MSRLLRTLLWLAAILLVIVLVVLFLIPVPPLRGSVPPAQLADPDSHFVEVNGLTVHYKLTGQGEPYLVLLHGFGSSTFSWREVMGPLAQYGTVIAFDRPAFGLTERPMPGEWQGENPYSAMAQVDLTIALMDHFSMKRATLVGNSAGGTIAVMTALRFPERVSSLILVSPAVYEGGSGTSWMRMAAALPQVRRVSPLLVRFLVGRLEQSLPTAWHDPRKVGPEVLEGYKKPLQVENWDRAFWEFMLAGRALDLDKQLDRITQPTLVIAGDDDRWVPTAQSVRLSQELPNADLAVLPNCGHVPQEECPAEFLQAVSSFLQPR